MSLEILRTMKLIPLSEGESRRGWIRLGNDSPSAWRRVPESKNNRCYTSSHRHGGVCGVGMLRSVIETSREILIGVRFVFLTSSRMAGETTTVTSYQNSKRRSVNEEVGVAHSSDDGFVMKLGAKEPYLVGANREGKDV